MADVDVIHFPFTAPVPWPARGSAVTVSLLDVQHLDLPHMFSRPERAYRSRYYDFAARTADAVVTISGFTKQRIIDRLGIDPERVTVAHLGVEPADFEPNLDDRERFLLYPARGWPHKNHARLIEAVGRVRADHPDLRLVLTGGGLTALPPAPEWVDVRGQVSEAELRELYRRAACLVFPSLYEGFGLPPLEAMASGCPVASSDSGSLPEICGDAAVLFDAMEPASIASGIVEAMEQAASLQRSGLERVRSFTWAGCAAAHEDAYMSAAMRRGES
jgi:glycosyltransferase involved in cell wall biosynthesis